MRIRVGPAILLCFLSATASPTWFSGGGENSGVERTAAVEAGGEEQLPLGDSFFSDGEIDEIDEIDEAIKDHDHDHGHKGLRWTSRGFASLGDSYSAGIGTHVEGDEGSCRLGLGAYPALLYSDLSRRPTAAAVAASASAFRFQWLSCTGSSTADVLGTAGGAGTGQIDVLDTSEAARLDFVTLSVGGNDLGFFDVINACVFRFYGLYSGTCATALEQAERLTTGDGHDDDDDDDDVFSQRLAVILLQLLDRARWERHPRFRVVVTGYARFFNADTAACDSSSMGVWRWQQQQQQQQQQHGKEKQVHGQAQAYKAGKNISDSTLLTRELRRRMNGLVAGANTKLRAAVDAANSRLAGPPRVLFVDYDEAFAGHRFCEPGVVEPDYDRDDTWFFLVGGRDSGNATADDVSASASASASASENLLLHPHSPLVDPDRCLEPAKARGDWGELALCYMAMARQAEPWLQAEQRAVGAVVSPQDMWYVPTYYGKTFHPRSAGYRAVRDALYRVWKEHGV